MKAAWPSETMARRDITKWSQDAKDHDVNLQTIASIVIEVRYLA
jgi:hypothetical protein